MDKPNNAWLSPSFISRCIAIHKDPKNNRGDYQKDIEISEHTPSTVYNCSPEYREYVATVIRSPLQDLNFSLDDDISSLTWKAKQGRISSHQDGQPQGKKWTNVDTDRDVPNLELEDDWNYNTALYQNKALEWIFEFEDDTTISMLEYLESSSSQSSCWESDLSSEITNSSSLSEMSLNSNTSTDIRNYQWKDIDTYTSQSRENCDDMASQPSKDSTDLPKSFLQLRGISVANYNMGCNFNI
jgi:hypothetical protein